jgi:hypothetical protein
MGRGGALVATLALVFQALVFAGHVHRLSTPSVIASSAAFGGSPVAPGHKPIPDHPADSCDLCAVLHLASAAVASAPPVLVLPTVVFRRQAELLPAAPVLAVSRHFLAQSRAPPLA